MKKALRILLAILIILVSLTMIFKNSIIKRFAEKLVSENTAFSMTIEELDVSLLKHTILLKGVSLRNPPDYPEPQAIAINELRINFDPISALSDNFHVYQANLDIARIVIVQKADGKTNIERLVTDINTATKKSEQAGSRDHSSEQHAPTPAPPQPTPKTAAEPQKQKGFLIDTLTLAFGEAEYLEYKEGNKTPEKQVLKLNRKRQYEDITSFEQIGAYIATEVVINQGLRELNKWAKDNKDSLGVKDEEIDEASKLIGGFLEALQKK